MLRFPRSESDQTLLASVQRGDEGARREFVERYADDVERLLHRVLGPDPEIADVMQDVFLIAFESLGQLRDATALRSWLGGIAIRKARKMMARRKRWRFIQFVAPAELPDFAGAGQLADVSDALKATYFIVRKLPTDDGIASALRYIDGMDLSAVASVTGVSLATVKRRLARAHRSFLEYAKNDAALSAFTHGEGLSR